ncbi:hypothetical protein NDU88_005196 [Pleurodeles waltl]|uniref:Uncharacterized protein n=1 Tax=Pleurodeles waltl TaxID=8319 RepID=A0AAV7PI67_PLEWA|nr:hypothetical protein NDU88_005196 [Pleurodeles waltl]
MLINKDANPRIVLAKLQADIEASVKFGCSGAHACNRVDDKTASTSGKSCSRGRANSVSSCLDDPGAGVRNESPDFRVLEREKKENGLRGEVVGAERGDGGPEREEEDKSPESPKRSPEEPNPARNTGERRSPEAGGETPKRRHVPGGAWLAKVRSLLSDRQFLA